MHADHENQPHEQTEKPSRDQPEERVGKGSLHQPYGQSDESPENSPDTSGNGQNEQVKDSHFVISITSSKICDAAPGVSPPRRLGERTFIERTDMELLISHSPFTPPI
jgi:hypothetical protein